MVQLSVFSTRVSYKLRKIRSFYKYATKCTQPIGHIRHVVHTTVQTLYMRVHTRALYISTIMLIHTLYYIHVHTHYTHTHTHTQFAYTTSSRRITSDTCSLTSSPAENYLMTLLLVNFTQRRTPPTAYNRFWRVSSTVTLMGSFIVISNQRIFCLLARRREPV